MSFRRLAVFDTQSEAVTAMPLADVARDIRRYEVLEAVDSGEVSTA